MLWQKLLSSALRELGLQIGLEELYLFLINYLIVFFFVDDICYIYKACDQALADIFRDNIHSRFKIRDLDKLK